MLKKPGRPREPITMEQIRTVLEAHSKYHLGTCLLECVLEVEIHKILKECGSARREPKKAKRRKWMIAYLDDSSRLVVAYGLFASATNGGGH